MANEPAIPAQSNNAALLTKFVENQSKELEHRAQELQLEKQKDDHAFEYGKEALAAQERDRKHERESAREQRRDRHKFILLILVVVAALLLGVIYLGQAQVALELTKSLGIFLAGAVGGYGYAKVKSSDSE
jgi:cation transport ATPase